MGVSIESHRDSVDRFFAYARERHRIYLRRAAGRPREEWTKDPLLGRYRFTNVYRELDKVTQWMRRYVREPYSGSEALVLAVTTFRMFNRIDTGEAMFCQSDMDGGAAFDKFAQTGDVRHLRRAIRSYVGARGPYVTGAYIISSPPGYAKLDGVLEVLRRFWQNRAVLADVECDWREVAEVLGTNSSYRESPDCVVGMETTWRWLRQHTYLGNFHSYEIACDLRYTPLLRDAPDRTTWANVGPGARRGMNRVRRSFEVVRDGVGWGRAYGRDSMYVEEMRELLRLSLDARHWPQWSRRTGRVSGDHGGFDRAEHWPRWEMREVEHTLCEFDKYERLRCGEGRVRGVYR